MVHIGSSTIIVALFNIIFGILVLAFPRFLRYFIGGYFLIIGIVMLLNYLI